MANIIKGNEVSKEIIKGLCNEMETFKQKHGYVPGLAIILVGDDPPSKLYVALKEKACKDIGINYKLIHLPEKTTQGELLTLIQQLNEAPEIHGILIQLPLPGHLEDKIAVDAIDPQKDVDGFTAVNMGNLVIGDYCFVSSMPRAVMAMLDKTGIEIAGKKAVIITSSPIISTPIAILLLNKKATVTLCSLDTVDLPKITRDGDIVIVALGREKIVKGQWLKPGAVVIDVGVNRGEDGKLVGDCDFDSCKEVASWITPVIGGMGPVTIAMLMANTFESAKKARA